MLRIESITKTFNTTGNKEDTRVALNNVSLEINDGEFVSIIGGNGSGKTTLMNIISGTLKPDSGHVYLRGEDITKLEEHKRAKFLGRVFQDPRVGTCGDMSALENIELANKRGEKRTLKWGFKNQNKSEYIEILKKVGLSLEEKLNQKVGVMSGGQRQALTLVMATLKHPELLLLDEHTAALDPKTASKVMHLTDLLVRENNLTTLMITHNMKDALNYGDRILMFFNGKLIKDISKKEKEKLTIEDLHRFFDEAELMEQN